VCHSVGSSHESRSRKLCRGMESVNWPLARLLCHCATVPACTPWAGGEKGERHGEPEAAFPLKTMLYPRGGDDECGR
jgi:hypothetical protein